MILTSVYYYCVRTMADKEDSGVEIPVGNNQLIKDITPPALINTVGVTQVALNQGRSNDGDSVDSRSLEPLGQLNPFRATASNTSTEMSLKNFVEVEIASTKAILNQQQGMLLSMQEAIKGLSSEQRRGKHKAHYMSDSSESEYYDYSDHEQSDGNQSRTSGMASPILNATKSAEPSSKIEKLDNMFEKKSNLGPAINNNLAKTINQGLTQTFDLKQELERADQFKTPENCEMLAVPKLNEELFLEESINPSYKKNDSILQKNQLLLTKGMIPLVKMMNVMLTKQTGNEELFDLASESVRLLALSHRDLSNIRRKFIKPAIDKRYQRLCDPSVPVTSQLFGDDLDEQLKSISNRKRLGTQIGRMDKPKKKRYSYDKPSYDKSHGHFHGKERATARYEPFLRQRRGRGGGYHSRQNRQRLPAHSPRNPETQK